VERLTREHYTAGVYVVAGASVQLCESYLTAEHRSTSVRVVLISDMTKVMTLGRRFGCFFCGQVVFYLCRNFNDFTTCKIPRF